MSVSVFVCVCAWQVVTFVEAIIARGFAYESNGSVYFHTAAFRAAGHHYPKLKVGLGADDAAASAAEMAEGEGALSQAFSDDKRSSSDFVLWKNSKPGEPAWPSPWGNVRVPPFAAVGSLSWLSIRLVFPALPRLVNTRSVRASWADGLKAGRGGARAIWYRGGQDGISSAR